MNKLNSGIHLFYGILNINILQYDKHKFYIIYNFFFVNNNAEKIFQNIHNYNHEVDVYFLAMR